MQRHDIIGASDIGSGLEEVISLLHSPLPGILGGILFSVGSQASECLCNGGRDLDLGKVGWVWW